MKRLFIGIGVACALFASAAGAVSKGGTLYIKTKEAKLLDKADAKAKTLKQLKPGEEVVWQGSAPENKQFHKITVGGKDGYTLFQNLSPNKPSKEVLEADGAPVDAQAFASSGAATKALSETALKYSGEKRDKKGMVNLTKGVMTAESVAKSVTKEEGVKYVQAQTGGAK